MTCHEQSRVILCAAYHATEIPQGTSDCLAMYVCILGGKLQMALTLLRRVAVPFVRHPPDDFSTVIGDQ